MIDPSASDLLFPRIYHPHVDEHRRTRHLQSTTEYFSDTESMILSLGARVAATITFGCAVYMCYRCYQSRARMFHRFMLGLSIHLLSSSAWNIYGTSAVPDSNMYIWGAAGSIQTCSAQGFFIQLSQAVPFYYVALSVYSFQAVRFNFDLKRYLWMENYIHMFVHAWPLGTATYLLTQQAYNPSAHLTCWIHSVPLECETDSSVECTRGPNKQNVKLLASVFAALPGILILLIPTLSMVCLIIFVKQHQSRIRLRYQAVAKQAAMYLMGLYASYLMTMINNGIQWISGSSNFVLAFLDVVFVNLIGVWVMLIYRYFRVPLHNPGRRKSTRRGSSTGFFIEDPSAASLRTSSRRSSNMMRHKSNDFKETDSDKSNPAPFSNPVGADTNNDEGDVQEDDYFNIFDGTNASGPWAQYIHDGDDDDEEYDAEESDRWKDIQDHI